MLPQLRFPARWHFPLQRQGPPIGSLALLQLADGGVGDAEIDEVGGVERIFLGGDLQRLDALILIAHNRGIVMAGDVEFLSLADVVAQLVGAGEVLRGLGNRARVQFEHAETGPRHRKLRVKFQGAFVMVVRFGNVVALLMRLIAQSIGAEGFERRRRGLTKRRIEPLDTGRLSPSLPRIVAGTWLSASSTCSLSGAVASALAISSPLAVFCASRVSTKALPRGAMLPVRIALTPSRSPISRAICGVMVSSCLRPRN